MECFQQHDNYHRNVFVMMRDVTSWVDEIKIIHETSPVDTSTSDLAIIEIIDEALGNVAGVLKKECLGASMKGFLRDFNVTILVGEFTYAVDLAPRSGEGHDFSFRVDKATGRFDPGSLCTGEVIPEPD